MSSVGRKTVKTEKPDIDPGSKWYLDPGGPRFITQQDSWEVDGSTYVTLMDADRKELARVIRYDWTKTLAVEQYRARIHPKGWGQLLSRATFVLDPFEDGTPIEKATRIPRILKPFVARRALDRERKKAANERKAARKAAREREANNKGT
jgi:hypothetical protein